MTLTEVEKKKIRREKRIGIRDMNTYNNLIDSKAIGYYKKFPNVKITTKIEDLGPNEKVSAMVDKAFKTLIANSRKPERLSKLLSQVIERTYEEINRSLMFYKNEFNKITINSKGYRGDCVLCIDNNIILIEINRTCREERNIKYLDSFYDIPLMIGEDRVEASSSTLININYYSYEGHEETIERYAPRNERGELLTFNKTIINIYVPKIIEKYYNGGEISELERIILVYVMTNIEEAKEIAKGDEILMEYIEESKLLEGDEIFVATYNKDIREADNPMTEIYEEGEEAGLKKGLQQGMEDKQNEIIRKLFSKGHSEYDISNTLEIPIDIVKTIIEISS